MVVLRIRKKTPRLSSRQWSSQAYDVEHGDRPSLGRRTTAILHNYLFVILITHYEIIASIVCLDVVIYCLSQTKSFTIRVLVGVLQSALLKYVWSAIVSWSHPSQPIDNLNSPVGIYCSWHQNLWTIPRLIMLTRCDACIAPVSLVLYTFS